MPGGHADPDGGTAPRSGADLHAASDGLDALALRPEPDVSFGKTPGQVGDVEAAAIILHLERHGAVLVGQPNEHVACLRVLDRVGEQLARGRQHEAIVWVAAAAMKFKPDRESRPAGRTLRHGADRSLEPGLLEDIGMQLEDGLAQLADRLPECGIGAAQGRMVDLVCHFLELQARQMLRR